VPVIRLPRVGVVAHEYIAAVANSAAVDAPASARIFAVGASPTSDDDDDDDDTIEKKKKKKKN
jgi:hypothetical protein